MSNDNRSLGLLYPYELIVAKGDHHLLHGGRTARSRDGKCETAFKHFEKTRGVIISDAIAVEKEMDKVIAYYFIPLSAGRIEYNAFIDLILGQESFSFSAKMRVVCNLVALAEIEPHTKSAVTKALEPVMKTRNAFAHRNVGIYWESQKIALWDATKRHWDSISADCAAKYRQKCRGASKMLSSILQAIRDLRRDNDET